MDSEFWIKAWKEGRTNFHMKDFNDKLIEYFPLLNAKENQNILVPLCGKTKDLIWLAALGLQVHGVEIYEGPVKEFFKENDLPNPSISQIGDFTVYSHKNISISCGDFFKLDETHKYDLVYDRASIVALPKNMRKDYAEKMKRLIRKGGKYLLISFEYDESKMDGPPFNVVEREIRELYQDEFSIELKESKAPVNPGARLSGMDSLKQTVYVLEKKF